MKRALSDKFDALFSLLSDLKELSRYKSLDALLSQNKLSLSSQDLLKLSQHVESQLKDALMAFALAQYRYFDLSGIWPECGKNQVQTSFYFLFHSDQDPDSHDALLDHDMAQALDAQVDAYGLMGHDIDYLKNYSRNIKISLIGHSLGFDQYKLINQILTFFHSSLVYTSGMQNGHPIFILGKGKSIKKLHYDVVLYQDEWVRSPQVIMPLAAMIVEDNICVRDVSLKSVMAYKWKPMVAQSASFSHWDPFYRLSNSIKRRCLDDYHIYTLEHYNQMQPVFLKDLRETILNHELGHSVMEYHRIDMDLVAISLAAQSRGGHIFDSLMEFMADFSAPYKSLVGPILNMIRISEKDELRAERMFYMYLSDVWFYDTDQEYMFEYSDIIVMILIKYIKPDKTIDFKKMQQDIHMQYDVSSAEVLEGMSVSSLSILDRILKIYTDLLTKIRTMVESAEYEMEKGKPLYTYKKASPFIHDAIRTSLKLHDHNSFLYKCKYWKSMLNLVNNVSPSKETIFGFINSQSETTLKKIMILSCGRKKAEAYQFDHRAYIIDRLTELNF